MFKNILIFLSILIFITQNNSLSIFAKENPNKNISIPVFCYHSVNPNAYNNPAIITPDCLKSQLTFIKKQGFNTLSINDLYSYLSNNSEIPQKSILITFDDGYMDNYYYAFPILKELNMKATIFCITRDLDGKYYLSNEAIKIMSANNIDIESHTFSHKKLSSLTYENQLKELEKSKKDLESITGNKVTAIAYPYGDYNQDTLKAASKAGYQLGFSTQNGFVKQKDCIFKLNRIYIGPNYDINKIESILSQIEK